MTRKTKLILIDRHRDIDMREVTVLKIRRGLATKILYNGYEYALIHPDKPKETEIWQNKADTSTSNGSAS